MGYRADGRGLAQLCFEDSIGVPVGRCHGKHMCSPVALHVVSMQTVRLSSQECSRSLGSQLDGELDYLVPMLLKKAGAASSGRDSFLAHHADLCAIHLLTKHVCSAA
jgi:hypothetical protein